MMTRCATSRPKMRCARPAVDAGFENISFQPEPIAAALDYEQRIDHEAVVLVVDIGGAPRTSRWCAWAPTAWGALTAWTMCWPPPACVGGTDFDRRLSLELLMPLLGFGTWGPAGGGTQPGVLTCPPGI